MFHESLNKNSSWKDRIPIKRHTTVRKHIRSYLLYAASTLAVLLLTASTSVAQSQYSTSIYGPLGLNTIPNARMDEAGTLRAQTAFLDPYLHGMLGFQIAEPLYIGIRQTGEVSTIDKNPDRFYPGLDLKLRLLTETKTRPSVAVGLQSAIGHKRMAGEYITASKRYNNFDFTAGIGWGRFAGAKHLGNPLEAFGNHFKGTRAADGQAPTRTADWFTGEHIGLFGGIEYFAPFLKGLSFKADFNGDRFRAENAAFYYDTPTPWSFGFNYKPAPYIDIGIAALGKDKVMGRLSLQTNIKQIRDRDAHDKNYKTLRPRRTEITAPGWMTLNAEKDGIMLSHPTADDTTAHAHLKLANNASAPHQIGHAAIHMANHAGPAIEEIKLAPRVHNLRGPTISFMRQDLEAALAKKQGSAEEIWHNAEIAYDFEGAQKIHLAEEKDTFFRDINLTLINQTSLAEEDNGFLHRNSAILSMTGPFEFGFLTSGLGFRLNLSDDLHKLHTYRPRAALPVRSDVDKFADRFLALDTAYGAFTHTIMPDLHGAVSYGYLEEMYAGVGGEILYRPFNKRFAVGAESWLALKRDPNSILNAGLSGDHVATGHINTWYDLPSPDVTIGLKAGRYLAEDLGATLSLKKEFKNGAKLEGYITASNDSDYDLFGGRVHHDHGIKLTIPLGGYKYTPNTDIKAKIAPFGRDIGQAIQSPLPLYETTEPLAKAHLIRHWDKITD